MNSNAIEITFWILLWTVLVLAVICEAMAIPILWRQWRKEKQVQVFGVDFSKEADKTGFLVLKKLDAISDLTGAEKIKQSWIEFNRKGGLNCEK